MARFRKLVAEVDAVRAADIMDENAPAWVAEAVGSGVLRADPTRDGKITDRILAEIGDAQASALAKGTVEYEAVRQIVADVITAGQDAGRAIVGLERDAALAAAKRENDAAVLRLLGTDASKWGPAFMDALMASPEPNAADLGDLAKWMAGQEALAVAWFANAIETARDAGIRQERDRARAEPAVAGATTRGQVEANLTSALDRMVTAATREIDFPDEDAIAFARAAPVAAPTPEVARTVAVAALRGLIAKWRRMTDRAGYTVEAGLAEDGCANDLESLIGGALAAPIADEVSLGIAKGGAAVKAEPLLRLFRFGHLRPELADLSRPFARLATFVAEAVPRSAERTLALRALWDAKNLAVVAVAQPPEESPLAAAAGAPWPSPGRPPGVPAAR